jgi:hypothetical protein
MGDLVPEGDALMTKYGRVFVAQVGRPSMAILVPAIYKYSPMQTHCNPGKRRKALAITPPLRITAITPNSITTAAYYLVHWHFVI